MFFKSKRTARKTITLTYEELIYLTASMYVAGRIYETPPEIGPKPQYDELAGAILSSLATAEAGTLGERCTKENLDRIVVELALVRERADEKTKDVFRKAQKLSLVNPVRIAAEVARLDGARTDNGNTPDLKSLGVKKHTDRMYG